MNSANSALLSIGVLILLVIAGLVVVAAKIRPEQVQAGFD